MGKIYILGSKESTAWAEGISKVTTIPSMTVNNNSAIHDFICRTFMSATTNDKIIIDLDAQDPALSLTIAMHIRLSVADIRQGALLPILFVSFLPLQSFLTLGECSQLFLTSKGISLCSPEDVKSAINEITGIGIEAYNTAFLDRIQIHPDASIGRHSMANQWGADVLYRLVCKEDSQETEEIVKAKKKLYYKYVYLQTVGLNEILNDAREADSRHDLIMLSALGKNILLIDDEADRGWSDVLHKWMFNCKTFDVENNRVANYEDIRSDIRQKIEADYYDLYLLDLRLLGNDEDDIYDAEAFSGMKVLKSIKEINRGNQVIIMTASNKAWNMKALLDAGADGYYIKESPELKLPMTFSEANFKSFKNDVEMALTRNGFKRTLYRQVNSFVSDIRASTKLNGDFANELVRILHSSLHQMLTAKSKKDFAYSYLTLFQSLEQLSRYYITEDGNNGWLINGIYGLVHYDVDKVIKPQQRILPIETKFPSTEAKILGIYVELCKGKDARFASFDLSQVISRRNAFVHNDDQRLAKPNIAKIYDERGFLHLLHVITTILSPLL